LVAFLGAAVGSIIVVVVAAAVVCCAGDHQPAKCYCSAPAELQLLLAGHNMQLPDVHRQAGTTAAFGTAQQQIDWLIYGLICC
jgi:hypothetical protein